LLDACGCVSHSTPVAGRAIIRHRPTGGTELATRKSFVIRKAHLTAGLWLGFFAMLMIHAGPLYSALQLTPPIVALSTEHSHDTHVQSGHHQQTRG
jgi:hypothetical protein